MPNIPKTIGLALGSGAARGLAHIGVFKALGERRISVSSIVGTSIGAVMGAMYAKDGRWEAVEDLVVNLDWKKLAKLIDPGFYFLHEGLINGDRIIETIHSVLGDVQFHELAIPFACVATDVTTGEEIVLTKGRVLDAIRASISIPGLFSAYKHEGRYLIDGGVVNPLPVSVVRRFCKDFVLAVDVSWTYQKKSNPESESIKAKLPGVVKEKDYLSAVNQKIKGWAEENKAALKVIDKVKKIFEANIKAFKMRIDKRPPSAISTILKSLVIMEHRIAEEAADKADAVIRPEVGHIDLLDFHRAQEAIRAGYRAAHKALTCS